MTALPSTALAAAEEVLALAAGREPTLGEGRLVCVDGPAGSGKTTLAAAIADRQPAVVVHVDDLLDGWDGLATLTPTITDLLGPLAEGRPGRYRRYDWHAGAFAEWVPVPPSPLLVVEGVGSGARAHAALTTVLVWVEVDRDLRLARGLARDGEAARPHWERFVLDEQRHFAAERTRDRADLRV